MVKVSISYGQQMIHAEVPEKNLLLIHKPKYFPGLREPRKAIERALENPIGGVSISQLSSQGKTVSIIIDDHQRPLTNIREITPVVIKKLNDAGKKNRDITVIMARGKGVLGNPKTIEERFQAGVISKEIKTIVNWPFTHKHLTFLGYSYFGTPIWIDRTVVETDIKIGIGVVTPRWWGGWGGGAKIIVPGVAGYATIDRNHDLMINVMHGNLDNPAILDREEIAEKVGLNMLINTVLNTKSEIAAIFAGDYKKAHRKAIEKYRELYEIKVAEKPDIIIASPDKFRGYSDFRGSVMDLVDGNIAAAERIADKGATLILSDPCPLGIYGAYTELMRTEYSVEDLANMKERRTYPNSQLLLALRYATLREKFNLIIVTRKELKEHLQSIGMNWAKTLREAIGKAIKRHGSEAKIAVLPGLGHITIPVLEKQT